MSKNIKLRHVNSNDFDEVWAYCSDPHVTKYLTWDHYVSKEDFMDFFTEKMLTSKNISNLFLVITIDNNVLGTAHIIQRAENVLQIGFGILPIYWNQGFGSQIIRLIEDYIVNNSNKKSWIIRADFHKGNYAVYKILKKQNYIFRKEIENNRLSFEREIKSNKESPEFLMWLKENEDVDCVLRLGSIRTETYSDLDIVILVYEESKVDALLEKIINYEKVRLIDKASNIHLFIRDENNQVYDIYIVSTACFNGMHNIRDAVFDKSSFISKLLGIQEKLDLSFLMLKFSSDIEKLLDKMNSKKYIQSTRILGDIRDKSIIPLGCYSEIIVASSIIDIIWKDMDNEFYKAYISTYIPPEKNELQNAIKELLRLLKYLTDKYSLYEYKNKVKELTEYANKL